MTAICWSPSPSVLLTSWSSRFLVFWHFWFVESAGNTVVSLMWLAEQHIDHPVEYLGAGPFKCTFTWHSQQRNCWNISAICWGFWRRTLQDDHVFTQSQDWMCCIHACISPYVSKPFFFSFCNYTTEELTGSIRCICIGCISMLLFAEQCILFAVKNTCDEWKGVSSLNQC